MQFLKRFITYLFSYGGAPLTLGCSSFDTKAVLAHSEQSSRFSNLRYQTASAIPSPHTRIGAAASARSTSPAHSAANSMGQSLFQNVYQNATKHIQRGIKHPCYHHDRSARVEWRADTWARYLGWSLWL